MMKTYTEQWREGKLPVGSYYILNTNGVEEIDKSVAIGELWNNTDLKEVLSPVPSYDEYKKLNKQLEEANRVIKRELIRQSPKGGVLLGDMNDYLKKWGVR